MRKLLRAEEHPPRLSWCGALRQSRPGAVLTNDRGGNVRRADHVGVYQRLDKPVGRLSGVCLCGQSMLCPVCAPRVAAARADEVAEAFKRATALGWSARLETFTIPHHRGNDLGEEIDLFARAWAHFQGGRDGVARRAGFRGYHIAREVTFGKNGWHYHYHRLVYFKGPVSDPASLKRAWLAALRAVDRYTPAAEKHAFDCGAVGSEAGARYVAKLNEIADAQALAVAREVTSQHNKGKSLFALLCAADDGDVPSGIAWVHAARVITVRKVATVRWSRGLRAALAMPAERGDDELAEEAASAADIYLGAITPGAWFDIYKKGREFQIVLAAQSGRDAVDLVLASWGLPALVLEDKASIARVLKSNVSGRPTDDIAAA